MLGPLYFRCLIFMRDCTFVLYMTFKYLGDALMMSSVDPYRLRGSQQSFVSSPTVAKYKYGAWTSLGRWTFASCICNHFSPQVLTVPVCVFVLLCSVPMICSASADRERWLVEYSKVIWQGGYVLCTPSPYITLMCYVKGIVGVIWMRYMNAIPSSPTFMYWYPLCLFWSPRVLANIHFPTCVF